MWKSADMLLLLFVCGGGVFASNSPTKLPTFYPTQSTTSSPTQTRSPTQSTTFSPTSTPPIQFTGYVADTLCVDIITPIKAINITTQAPLHSIECLLLKQCVESGYTMVEEVGDIYVSKYQLDQAGVDIVVAALNEAKSANCINNFSGTVYGYEDGPASFNGKTSYYGGSHSYGLKLKVINGSFGCGGDIEYPASTTTNPQLNQQGSTEVKNSAIAAIVVISLLAVLVIFGFEHAARRQEGVPDKA